MEFKNYYIILGITPNTGTDEVRCAFRRLAKKFHPDKAGREKTSFFQDITEAYEILSDPEKRKLYNQKLTEEEKSRDARSIAREEFRYETLRKNYASNISQASHFKHDPAANHGTTYRSAPHFKKSAGFESGSQMIELDAFLTDQEAFSGVTLNLRLSLPVTCQRCRGMGHDFIFKCIRCHGSGFTTTEKPVDITLPPNLNNGDRIKATLALAEENNLHLLFHVYII